MNLTLLFVIWCVVAAATAATALYRRSVVAHAGAGVDTVTSKQIQAIDKWGMWLTVLTVVLGLILAGAYLLPAWMADGGKVNMR